MNSRRAALSMAAGAMGIALALTACGGGDAGAEAGGGGGDGEITTLTIATSNDAPFSFTDDAGALQGIDGEMINWIADKKGWEVEVFVSEFATLIPAIKAGKADAVVDAMYITDVRKEEVNFTDTWYQQGEGMVVPGDSDMTDRDDAKGTVIGVQTGTTFIELAESLEPKEIKYFDSQAALLTAVENKQVDVVFTDAAVVAYSLVQNPNDKIKIVDPYEPFFPGLIGAAVPKENTQLLEELNSGLAELKASPDYMEILAKYGLTESNAVD
ncbi:ABC transporter substrate-binding protein [Arthrobacter bussei]|uniref:Amino acid ABC transporter substrate-binding protein n=1 Tax=Arthrobacter bussei TaxID=2594179 RepID=A0A7X1TPB3_9MICC|nr:ABC transporter substrate-binding protein [Arthrobacter bussei]MPY11453.1 amino acid ABC transporter substrate-binding protein [Arthrobacter bussei]